MRSNCTHASKIQFWKPLFTGDQRLARTSPISSASCKNSLNLAVYYWINAAKQHPPVRHTYTCTWELAWRVGERSILLENRPPRANTADRGVNVKLACELLWERISKIPWNQPTRAVASGKQLKSILRLKIGCELTQKSLSRADTADKRVGSKLLPEYDRGWASDFKLKSFLRISGLNRHTGTQRILPPLSDSHPCPT